MKLGVLGGTFDPVHNGHLAVAEEARAALELDRVLFVPARQNPLKRGRVMSPAEDRTAMVALAIADNPGFAISRVDLDRPPPSYTVDMLAALRDGLEPDDELYFILGSDSLAELAKWYQPERLLELASLVAVSRPGYAPVNLQGLEATFPGISSRVRLLPIPELAISSADLRRRVQVGLPIRYQVPDAVERFVRERKLYRTLVEQRI